MGKAMSIAKSDINMGGRIICAYGTWYNMNTKSKAIDLIKQYDVDNEED